MFYSLAVSTMYQFRATALCILWGLGVAHAAINLDGSPAMAPLSDGDPSPIASINTYHPNEHDCPLPCKDVTNVHSWVTYFSVNRLKRCNEPMLLQLSVTQPLDDPLATVLLHSCTLTTPGSDLASIGILKAGILAENPKLSETLAERGVDTAKACFSNGVPAVRKLELFVGRGSDSDQRGETLQGTLGGLQKFFEAPDNCDEQLAFAYHNGTVVGIYVGEDFGKPTVSSALTLLGRQNVSSVDRAVAQLCDGGQSGTRTFGMVVDTTGNLAAVQKIVSDWNKGVCIDTGNFGTSRELGGVEVFSIGNHGNVTVGVNSTFGANASTNTISPYARKVRGRGYQSKGFGLASRATCRYVEVVSGDSCGALADRCGVNAQDFYKYNPKDNLCSGLMPGDFVCCSSGDQYSKPKPVAPKRGADGICATHLIVARDTCHSIAEKYGITTAEIEKWNKGRTWAWTGCERILTTYNMCVSDGDPPLPPPSVGTECGPLVPGSKPPPTNVSFTLLNPCPLKACCSNWGYCGVFPGHCNVNTPVGGGPGSTPPGVQSTCVSNCGNDIKTNGGPPQAFQRIGYYESWNLGRDCLWLEAKDANTDGSYTHMHWGFADIDPATWKPVINDTMKQWAGFKALKNVKRIVAFGGWAYSTEPATYNIMRQAILDNASTFAQNIAKFLQDEGLDGVDIDWEYPGAPDIKVNGRVIGQEGDGRGYYNFLKTLKDKVGPSKSVSIAAPASFYYLKAFPIDRIANVIDYIVYMTYDLHGQWDAGKPNSYDSCDSGYCIRSHVNLTETRNALSIITKAGVPNSKVFVGEASYGRSFRMKEDGCWRPMCEFTGTPEVSHANPGRCTKTSGYLGYAEIMELMRNNPNVNQFHDGDSNTDVLLYDGDYISYMTPITKETRRDDWKKLNFGGSVDWAVDLQAFSKTDMGKGLKQPSGEKGCVGGLDVDIETGEMCAFACHYGVCPQPLCECIIEGKIKQLPPVKMENVDDVIAFDTYNVDVNRLCKFVCKYGFCPEGSCTTVDKEEDEDPEAPMVDPYAPVAASGDSDRYARRGELNKQCFIYRDTKYRDKGIAKCEELCKDEVNRAKAEGRTTNYGCVGNYPLDKPIPWDYLFEVEGGKVPGRCVCDHAFVNTLADLVIDAMPAIAQIGCYIVMSSLKLVITLGLNAIPGAGRIIEPGLDALATAAQIASYVYPDDQNPQGTFEWWLSPCGGSEFVPKELQRAFDILHSISEGRTSFKKPEKHPKGSGKNGDASNPKPEDRDRGRPAGNKNPGKSGSGGGANSSANKPKQCKIPAKKKSERQPHRLRVRECKGRVTKTTDFLITSVQYAAGAAPSAVERKCLLRWEQACLHYSSAIEVSRDWNKIVCPQEAATKSRPRGGLPATLAWNNARNEDWLEWENSGRREEDCHRDEYPPIYLLNDQHDAWKNSGKSNKPGGQLMRFLPGSHNTGAASLWNNACFKPVMDKISDREFRALVLNNQKSNQPTNPGSDPNHEQFEAKVVPVNVHPYFTITAWEHAANPPVEAGLWENPCWPMDFAPLDPGFALLDYDPWNLKQWPLDGNGKKTNPYDYTKPRD